MNKDLKGRITNRFSIDVQITYNCLALQTVLDHSAAIQNKDRTEKRELGPIPKFMAAVAPCAPLGNPPTLMTNHKDAAEPSPPSPLSCLARPHRPWVCFPLHWVLHCLPHPNHGLITYLLGQISFRKQLLCHMAIQHSCGCIHCSRIGHHFGSGHNPNDAGRGAWKGSGGGPGRPSRGYI